MSVSVGGCRAVLSDWSGWFWFGAGGTVSIWSLGSEQFHVQAPGHDSEVEGFEQARALAHQVATELE